MDQEFDLWGDPVPPRVEKRGRPEHKKNQTTSMRVAVLRALNKPQDEIAAALAITEKTLRKHYSPELRQGLQQKRAEALVRLWEIGTAGNGNVAALKEFIRQTERADLAAPVALARRPAKAVKLGKKEQAIVDAQTPDESTSIGELMARRNASLQVH